MSAKESSKVLVENRQAKHQYAISDSFTAGIILQGWEVKAMLAGHATFNGGSAFVRMVGGEAFLEGLTVTPLVQAGRGMTIELEPNRSRKLLLNRAELDKLAKKVAERGFTIVPLAVIGGRKFKVEIALAKGKNHADKRESIKARDLDREMARAVQE